MDTVFDSELNALRNILVRPSMLVLFRFDISDERFSVPGPGRMCVCNLNSPVTLINRGRAPFFGESSFFGQYLEGREVIESIGVDNLYFVILYLQHVF